MNLLQVRAGHIGMNIRSTGGKELGDKKEQLY